MADDLGYGDVSCYGQKHFSTPHIDRLAKEGTRFSDAYAGCSVCAPSRSVLMTGMHMGHTSVRSNPGGVPLLESDVTVAELLKRAGYSNGIFGKWGLGDIGTPTTAIQKGFDEHTGFLHQAHAHFHYPRFIYRNDREFPLPGNSDSTQKTYANDVMVSHGLDFIRTRQSSPFFAYFSLTVPHFEPRVPEDSLAPFRGKFPESTWGKEGGRGGLQKELSAAFAGMVTRMDGYVGQITALLRELDLEENTVVFFTSDNGSINASNNFFESAGPLRGMKGTIYEGGLRVPMIARWPGHIPAGRVSEFPWTFQDFLPTALDLAGAPRHPCDGISVLPTLRGGKQRIRRDLYWELPRYLSAKGSFADEAPRQALRRDRWKIVRPAPNGPVELYDLKADPSESRDLASAQAALKTKLERALTASRTPPRPQKEPAHPWWEARS